MGGKMGGWKGGFVDEWGGWVDEWSQVVDG